MGKLPHLLRFGRTSFRNNRFYFNDCMWNLIQCQYCSLKHDLNESLHVGGDTGKCIERCSKELICPRSFHFHAIFTLITKNNNLACTETCSACMHWVFCTFFPTFIKWSLHNFIKASISDLSLLAFAQGVWINYWSCLFEIVFSLERAYTWEDMLEIARWKTK